VAGSGVGIRERYAVLDHVRRKVDVPAEAWERALDAVADEWLKSTASGTIRPSPACQRVLWRAGLQVDPRLGRRLGRRLSALALRYALHPASIRRDRGYVVRGNGLPARPGDR
jgi:hypothetical protein